MVEHLFQSTYAPQSFCETCPYPYFRDAAMELREVKRQSRTPAAGPVRTRAPDFSRGGAQAHRADRAPARGLAPLVSRTQPRAPSLTRARSPPSTSPAGFLLLQLRPKSLSGRHSGHSSVGREGARARLSLSAHPHSSHPAKETSPCGCPSPLLQGLGKVSSSFPRPTPPTHSTQGDIKKC